MKKAFYIILILILTSCVHQKKAEQDIKIDTVSVQTKTKDLLEKEEIVPIGTGRITTIADGFDVQQVNLWNSTESNRTINCYLLNGDKVKILKDEDPYYFVQAVNKNYCRGYCMKGFIIKD